MKTHKTLIKTKAYLLPRISDCLALFNYKTKGYCVALFVETCMVVYHKVSYLNVRSSTEDARLYDTEEVVFPSASADTVTTTPEIENRVGKLRQIHFQRGIHLLTGGVRNIMMGK